MPPETARDSHLSNPTSVAGRSLLLRLLALRPRIAAGVPLIGDSLRSTVESTSMCEGVAIRYAYK